MTKTIDKGRSFLNATDDAANPYGLILSEKEQDFIYGGLTRLDNMTNALLYGKTGWKQQLSAALSAAAELGGLGFAAIVANQLADVPIRPVLMIGLAFLVLQKLNLLRAAPRAACSSGLRPLANQQAKYAPSFL